MGTLIPQFDFASCNYFRFNVILFGFFFEMMQEAQIQLFSILISENNPSLCQCKIQ